MKKYLLLLCLPLLFAVGCFTSKGGSAARTDTIFGVRIIPGGSGSSVPEIDVGLVRSHQVFSATNDTRGVGTWTDVQRKGWNREKLRTGVVIGGPTFPQGAPTNFWDSADGDGYASPLPAPAPSAKTP